MENGSDDTRQQVPAPFAVRGRRPRMQSGMMWMLAGCMVSFIIPFLGTALAAYGAREMVEDRGIRGYLLACLNGIVISAMAFISDFANGAMLVGELVCVLGIVWVMRNNRSTVLGVSLVIVATALINIGFEAALAVASGSSLGAVVDSLMAMVSTIVVESAGTGLEAEAFAKQVMPLFQAIWPFIYVGAAASDALAAGVGSFLMRSRTTGISRTPMLVNFDMPLWAVGVLGTSVLGIGISSSGFPGADVVLTVSATALMSVRFIFAIQGFAVVTFMANRMRLGCLGRFLLVFLSVQLETVLFALSIVGLIDVWANFRKLPRGGSGNRANT